MFRTIGSFFTQLRQKLFDKRVNHEIFDRLMPHVQQEKDHGYSFSTNDEMDALTREFDIHSLLDSIEQQITNMPTGYSKKFRHIMRRDLYERLTAYEKLARRRVSRTCDPRFVAEHA